MVPGDSFELAGAFATGATQRVEQALRRVFAVEIFGYFAAEEAAGDGVRRIAAEFGAVALVIDVDEQGAGVRAIEGADGMESLRQEEALVRV